MKYSEFCAICAETDFFCNIPKSHNRKRRVEIDFQIRQKIRQKTKDKRLSVGRYCLITAAKNFGNKKFPDNRIVNEVFQIKEIKGTVLYDMYGIRHNVQSLKNNLVATFTNK